ncbi:MAG: 50S ribosomal protein L29 [Candidatus Liptonbacteria bacterium]|nr:50S ribosomal protein L29 [Candidatus Liptonbacteria bacterium]
MKRSEFQELKNKPLPELQKVVSEKRERLQSLRFDLSAGKVKNVSEIRKVRKDIAQALTLIQKQNNKNQ